MKYFPKVKAVIKKDINQIIEIVKDRGVQSAINQLSTKVDSGGLHVVIADMYKTIGLRFARRQQIEFNAQKRNAKKSMSGIETKGFGFNEEWVNFIKDYLYRFLLEKITFQVADTTKRVLLNVLQKSIEEGWGVDETVKALDDLPLSATQAERIVRTEVTRAANTGAMAAGYTFEFEQSKEWISAHDLRTRGTNPKDHASHVRLDGTVVDYEDYFIDPRNGDKLRFPGDPGGNGIPETHAASTVNCRCAVAVVAKFDENGRLIPKKKSPVRAM